MSNNNSKYSIKTNNLTRHFGDLVAVDNLDLKVNNGEFYGFVGPNGAEKYTTISMQIGLLEPTSGTASVLDYDIKKDAMEIKRRIGVVPENLNLFERLTGWEYLTFVGKMFSLSSDDIKLRGDELLELMELEDKRNQLIVDYSHGMKKKIAIASVLLHDPQIIFLDEPFEGIDAITSRAIREILQSLIDRKVTIFLTSHILDLVEKLCTRIGILYQGKLLAEGTLDEIKTQAKTANLEEAFISIIGDDHESKSELSWMV